MSRRPAHKIAHAQCPYGVFNWSECDAAASHRWGQCKAMIENKANEEPRECLNWAIGDNGWCGQHYAKAHDMAMDAARKAEHQLQLEADFVAFEELKTRDPWFWLKRLRTSAESTQGIMGVPVTGVRAAFARGTTSSGSPSDSGSRGPRKLPHPIRERKLPHRID